jgi:bifunctional DNase/RNase
LCVADFAERKISAEWKIKNNNIMDKELQMYGYELTSHEITHARLIKLKDIEDKILLIVPMEMFAVNTFFRCMFKQETPSVPAHKMFLDVMEALEGKMLKVLIDDLQAGRFFATVYFTNHESEEYNTRAEASDALAMAFCASCPVYIKESVIKAAKSDRANRVYWYDPEDEESLAMVRSYSHGELVAFPSGELEQLLEIATDIEDFEFAARIKKALDTVLDRQKQFAEIINNVIAEDPEKFISDLKNSLKEGLRDSLNDEIDDDSVK